MDRELEDDVKRCNELIKVEHANWIGISNQLAISNVLAEREKDKKRIHELEEERQLVGMLVKNKRDGRIGIVLHQWENGSVAVLESINPRVINTHDSWNTLEIITDEVKQVQTNSDSIPTQVVIDKINEYDKKMEEDAGHPHWVVTDRIVMNVLQELLEGGK